MKQKQSIIKVDELKVNEGDLLIWTIGDLKHSIIPDRNMLKGFEKLIVDGIKNGNFNIFVPPYVKVKKISFNKNTKVKVEVEKK